MDRLIKNVHPCRGMLEVVLLLVCKLLQLLLGPELPVELLLLDRKLLQMLLGTKLLEVLLLLQLLGRHEPLPWVKRVVEVLPLLLSVFHILAGSNV